MKTIDLHDYYDWCPKGTFIEIADEIAEVLQNFIRDGVAYQVKNYRHNIHLTVAMELSVTRCKRRYRPMRLLSAAIQRNCFTRLSPAYPTNRQNVSTHTTFSA